MGNTPLEHADVVPVFNALNVTASDSAIAAGGTAAHNHWVSLQNFQALGAKIAYIARDTGYVGEVFVEQAQDNQGTNLELLKSFTLNSTQLNASGDVFCVNVLAAELDTVNNMQFVRIRFTQTGGTTTNTFTMTYLLSSARFQYLTQTQYTYRFPQDQSSDQFTG